MGGIFPISKNSIVILTAFFFIILVNWIILSVEEAQTVWITSVMTDWIKGIIYLLKTQIIVYLRGGWAVKLLMVSHPTKFGVWFQPPVENQKQP